MALLSYLSMRDNSLVMPNSTLGNMPCFLPRRLCKDNRKAGDMPCIGSGPSKLDCSKPMGPLCGCGDGQYQRWEAEHHESGFSRFQSNYDLHRSNKHVAE